MKFDRNKILQKAQTYIQKNQLDKAVAEYEVLVKAKPDDVNSLIRLAGLYLRINRGDEAVDAYRRAGQHYAKTGFPQKALAAYKQALQQRTDDPELMQQLGEIYLQMSMRSQAVDYFAKAADLFQRNRKHPQALEMMQRVIDAEPDRPDLKARYGEMLYQSGRQDEALAVFRGLVEILKLEGHWEELARFYERILQLSPGDAEIGKDLARTYLRLGLAPRAQQRLKQLYDENVRDAEVFDLLARSYVLLGKNERAVSAYIEKVRRLEADGDSDEVQRTWRRVLEIDPTHEQAIMALGEAEDAAAEVVEATGDAEVVEVVVGAEPEPAPAAPAPAGGSGSHSEFSEILQEASVYIRYGIREKAIRKLDGILARDPNNIPALRKRVDLFKDTEPARAVPDLLHLSELYEGLGDMQAADEAVEQAKRLDPRHPQLMEFLGLGGGDDAAAAPAEVDPAPAPATIEDVAPAETEDITEVEVAVETDIELDLELAEDEADEPAVVSDVAAAPDWQNEIDEIAFYIDTEHYAEARALLGDLRARFGDEPAFAELEARMPADAAAAKPAAPAKAKPQKPQVAEVEDPATDSSASPLFDLARELDLDEDLDFGGGAEPSAPGAEDVPTFEEIFDAFKQGVKEQIDEDDADAHYDLGIAYMEMGLYDDAVSEFEVARRNPSRAGDACNMAAVALTRKGEMTAAVEYYRAGLAYDNLPEGLELNLHYELALALDELGDYRGALQHFKAVLEKDRTYREVGQRLKTMKEKLEARKAGGNSKPPENSNVTYL